MPRSQDLAGPAATGRAWLTPTLLFLGLCAVYLPTISHAFLSFDVFGSNWTSWHLVAHGTPWIDGEAIPDLQQGAPKSVFILTAPNGHEAWGRFPGVVVAAVPAYALAHLLSVTSMTTVPGSLTAAVLTAAAVTLMFLALARHLGRRPALLAALAFGLTTPVWSVAANGMWPHTLTVLGIAGMAWAASTGRWWLVGLFGGLALWGRLHVALVVAVTGVLSGWQRRDLRVVVQVAFTSGLCLAAYSLWVHWMYGVWNPVGAYATGEGVLGRSTAYHVDVVNQLGMWIAPDRGVLVWTPVAALLLPALVRSWRQLPDWSRSLLVGGVVYTVVGTTMMTFTGGEAFYGYRYGLELLACATPALALATPRMGAVARGLLGPVLAVQLLAIALGALTDLYLPESQVWRDNAFVHLLAGTGAAGVLLVALTAAAGGYASRLWRRTPTAAERPDPAPLSPVG